MTNFEYIDKRKALLMRMLGIISDFRSGKLSEFDAKRRGRRVISNIYKLDSQRMEEMFEPVENGDKQQ